MRGVWATDLNDGGGTLAIGLLVDNGQPVLYIPGRTVHHASRTYRGDGKTDAKDAGIIADQARMRRDLHPVRAPDEVSVELRLFSAHRSDLVADRTRAINRLRAALLGYFPALEAAFDYSLRKGALTGSAKQARSEPRTGCANKEFAGQTFLPRPLWRRLTASTPQ